MWFLLPALALAEAPSIETDEQLLLDTKLVEICGADPALSELGSPRLIDSDTGPVGIQALTELESVHVHTAPSLLALSRVASGPDFDLILLDCQMPDIDGFETCERLRATGWTRPILALTAGVTAEERQRCADSGMDDVLAKPTSIEALREAMTRWTDPKRLEHAG